MKLIVFHVQLNYLIISNNFFQTLFKGTFFWVGKWILCLLCAFKISILCAKYCKFTKIHTKTSNRSVQCRALEWSYGAKNMRNRKSLEIEFLHWKPCSYDLQFLLQRLLYFCCFCCFLLIFENNEIPLMFYLSIFDVFRHFSRCVELGVAQKTS